MKPVALLAIPFAFLSNVALAGTVDGNGALAIAALAAEHSPVVKGVDKIALIRLLNGQIDAPFPAGRKIEIKADAVSCRASNVDLTEHLCDLSFGTRKITTSGRRAHELYATLAEIGLTPDGAAGSISESLSNLACLIDPAEIKQKGGGGAHCSYDPPK